MSIDKVLWDADRLASFCRQFYATSSSRSDDVTLLVCLFVCLSPFFCIFATFAPWHGGGGGWCVVAGGGWWWSVDMADELNGYARQTSRTDQLYGQAERTSWKDQFSIFEALASSLIQRLTFQFVHCDSPVRRRPCLYWNRAKQGEIGLYGNKKV